MKFLNIFRRKNNTISFGELLFIESEKRRHEMFSAWNSEIVCAPVKNDWIIDSETSAKFGI